MGKDLDFPENLGVAAHTARGLLNKDTSGIQIAKIGEPCNFYMRKASYWKALLYVTIGITVIIAIASLVSWLVR